MKKKYTTASLQRLVSNIKKLIYLRCETDATNYTLEEMQSLVTQLLVLR